MDINNRGQVADEETALFGVTLVSLYMFNVRQCSYL